MKKIISILLAAAMVLAFAACGNNSGNNGGNDAAVTDPLEVLGNFLFFKAELLCIVKHL